MCRLVVTAYDTTSIDLDHRRSTTKKNHQVKQGFSKRNENIQKKKKTMNIIKRVNNELRIR